MANIKDLKKRIKSTKGTFKITSAMKLVSAAKLARAQSKIQGLRPYANELESTVKTVSALAQNYSHAYLKENTDNNKAIVLVISSDKGLCGGYNTQLSRAVKSFTKNNPEIDCKFVFIGKKVRELIAKDVNAGQTYKFAKADPSIEEIRKIAEEMAHLFTSGEVGNVYVAYNIFQSAISFKSTVKKVLPMTNTEEEIEKLKTQYPYDFKYDPSPESILDTLIPEVFNISVYSCVLDAIAAEHGSRMSSMESASKNCKKMIKTLTLKMNKLRQAKITTELIEVVSGAESLNG
jgi:F-type H+-transporting ATPase subunit gamma